MKLAPKRQNVIKSSVNMTDNAYRKLYYSFQDEEKEASKNGETLVNFLATPYSVAQSKAENTSHVQREDFNVRKEYLQGKKQGDKQSKISPQSAATVKNIVNYLHMTKEKDEDILVFESEQSKLEVGFYSDSATFDGIGRNIDAFCFMSVAKPQKLRVHPFNVFQGADSKQNCVNNLSLYIE